MAGATGAAKFVDEIGNDGEIYEEQDELGDRRTYKELVNLER